MRQDVVSELTEKEQIFYNLEAVISRFLDIDHILSQCVQVRFYICKNKGADQLRSNCEADQHLCFHYMDSTISLSKSKISRP